MFATTSATPGSETLPENPRSTSGFETPSNARLGAWEWILLATIFMREFSLSLFLYTPASEPVGPLLYFLWLDGLTGPLGALGILVSVVSAVLVAVASRYSRIAG